MDDQKIIELFLKRCEEAITATSEKYGKMCRQLRLRNLSGIIVIDFINMKNPDDIYKIRDVLIKELSDDPIPAKYVDITKLGLIELTRKKLKRPLHEMFL